MLTNYACSRIYATIEDGVDGQLVNTAKYEALYQEALLRLERYARPAPRHTPFIKRHAGWF